MSIDPMACGCWGCRPDLMAAEYARNNQVVPAHEMAAVAGTIARLKGELERVTAERDQARAELAEAKVEADRATQMWSHAEADAQTARPIVRAAQAWRAEISADKTLQEAWGGHPLAVAVDRLGELDDEQAATVDPGQLAQLFHSTYERLAPDFGYRTREASAKPWADVPEANRKLMIATCAEVLKALDATPAEEARTDG